MYRTGIEQLQKWKAKANRKPLIIRGARQVGKTWLMKTFGSSEYESMVYIDFEYNEQMRTLFEGDLKIERLVTGMELYAGHKINPNHTLLVFDEVQEVPRALTSLKYFNENAPQYQIVCASSFLGVALQQGTSFPVGKVEFLDLCPLSFFEFLTALGKGGHAELLKNGRFDTAAVFKQDYMELLKQYCYIGGMPEAVQSFADNRDFNEVREIQQRILTAYEQDSSSRAPRGVLPRIRALWNSIPAQLAKENKKFVYGLMKEGSRAKDYELAMFWLSDCGLIHKVHRISTPQFLLRAYEDFKAFKLYLLDVGLLSCMAGLRQDILLDGNELFKVFHGALAEQYVLQQFKTIKDLNTYYWTAVRGIAEIDFVIDHGMDVIPVEVTAEVNLQAKSLKVYREKFHPTMAVRTSAANYKIEDQLVDLPLWAIGSIGETLSGCK